MIVGIGSVFECERAIHDQRIGSAERLLSKGYTTDIILEWKKSNGATQRVNATCVVPPPPNKPNLFA